jgi:hypothetical protein
MCVKFEVMFLERSSQTFKIIVCWKLASVCLLFLNLVVHMLCMVVGVSQNLIAGRDSHIVNYDHQTMQDGHV